MRLTNFRRQRKFDRIQEEYPDEFYEDIANVKRKEEQQERTVAKCPLFCYVDTWNPDQALILFFLRTCLIYNHNAATYIRKVKN